jgi:hypothetical protein
MNLRQRDEIINVLNFESEDHTWALHVPCYVSDICASMEYKLETVVTSQ